MRNIKDRVYTALSAVLTNVTDQYPTDWENLPAVQYCEEDNRVYERTNDGEATSYVRYRIDIWHNRSTSEYALLVDDALGMNGGLGLARTSCADIADPSALKHKQMRYEGIIDLVDDHIYWNT